MLNIIDTLTDKVVTLISHKESIDTDTPTGQTKRTNYKKETKVFTKSSRIDKIEKRALKKMEEFIKWLECIEDMRQQSKVRYTVQEVILIVFCSTLARVENWEDRAVWAEYYLDYLKEYLPYENGVPSHDTMQRVMGMIATEYFQQAYNKWIEAFERGEGINLRKIICIDGKTMRGNKQNDSKPNHIITAWSKEGGYSLGQKQ